jgi:hypothetical protein
MKSGPRDPHTKRDCRATLASHCVGCWLATHGGHADCREWRNVVAPARPTGAGLLATSVRRTHAYLRDRRWHLVRLLPDIMTAATPVRTDLNMFASNDGAGEVLLAR